jgi:hypothetical protein
MILKPWSVFGKKRSPVRAPDGPCAKLTLMFFHRSITSGCNDRGAWSWRSRVLRG